MDIIKFTSLPEYHASLRVVAYARVSKEKESMLHSLNAQVDYYTNLIKSNAEFSYAGIYADEGISGTKEDRPEFTKMMEDARSHKFDMIITKSVSRFARNLVLLLKSIRELKQLGIDVYFEEENIHTLSYEGEIMLTIFASTAEEEVKSMSLNMLWRISKDMERGLIWGGADPYGYYLTNKKLVVNIKEAKVVKMIFDLYEGGLGDTAIAKRLNELKIKPRISEKWNKNSIRNILLNISYTGDLLLQKTYRPVVGSKRTEPNRSAKPQYHVENSHEAIVSKEKFNRCIELRIVRKNTYKANYHKVSYPLSGLIKCGNCLSSFKHKKNQGISKWKCSKADDMGLRYCSNKSIPESAIYEVLANLLGAYDELTIKQKVMSITAYPGNRLVVQLSDGTSLETKWKMPSRKDSWTAEMKEKARRRNYANRNKN